MEKDLQGLAETLLLGKVAAVRSLSKRLAELWEFPLPFNLYADKGRLAVNQVTIQSIKNLIGDLETDVPNFFNKNYSKVWAHEEEET